MSRVRTSLLIILPILFFIQDKLWRIKLFSFEFLGRNAPFDEIAAGACFLLWGGAVLLHLQNSEYRERNYRSVVLGFVIAASISYLFGSVIVYDQDPWRLWRVMFWFSGLLMYFHLMRMGGHAEQAARVFRFLVFYGLVVAIFSVLVTFIRPLAAFLDEYAVSTRFGMVRVIIFDDGIALLYFFFLSRLLVVGQKRSGMSPNLLNWLGVGLALFCLIFIELSRQRIVAVTIVTLFAGIFSLALPGFRKQAALWLVIVVIVCGIMGVGLSGFMGTLSSSLDTSRTAIKNEANLSVYVREQGIRYYYNQFVKTSYLGIGWISAVTTKQSNPIVQANLAGMKLVDLGIFEVIFRYGFPGLFVYLLFFWTSLRQAKFLNRHGDAATRVIGLTLGLFLLSKLVVLNTIFFFPAHCLFYAVIMYVLDALFQSARKDQRTSVAV
jgi:hypothetical protein